MFRPLDAPPPCPCQGPEVEQAIVALDWDKLACDREY